MASTTITVNTHISDLEQVSNLIAACRGVADALPQKPGWLVRLLLGKRYVEALKAFYDADADLINLLTPTDGTDAR